MSKSVQGIDFHQALAILSARSAEKHEETKHEPSCPCSSNGLMDEDKNNKFLPTMGQIIRLDGEEEGTTTTKSTTEENSKDTEMKSERKQEWLDGIGKLSTRRLLQAVLEAQQQRVATYREYDR